jgi:unsaturated chondroitin disaccharide hydrolase|tara:strand:- start:646 stop:858 length:213 start_codon:yes stop_codon:yes gene_type:complete
MIDFIKKQSFWPEDDISFWDMRDPRILKAPRDASAVAITASACFELYEFTQDEEYLSFVNDIMTTLSSEK